MFYNPSKNYIQGVKKKLQDSLDRGEVKQVLACVHASVRAIVLANVISGFISLKLVIDSHK